RICFRGEFAAASLKLAVNPKETASHDSFRGEFAAASLKRTDEPTSAQGRRGFPRRIRRGLIEASLQTLLTRLLVGFRGEFAAASLKPRRHGPLPRRHLRFRGEFAAASLKRYVHDRPVRRLRTFPRRIRRGLI